MQEKFLSHKLEANFCSTEGSAQEIDLSLEGYAAADEKRNTVFPPLIYTDRLLSMSP